MIWYNDEHKKRAFKSFASFVIECKNDVIDYRTNKYKCLDCHGSGSIRDPKAFNDPVEGYKMADHITCLSCRGTGESDEKTWRAFYKEEKANYALHVKKKREQDALRKSALKKLTPEEKKALNIY